MRSTNLFRNFGTSHSPKAAKYSLSLFQNARLGLMHSFNQGTKLISICWLTSHRISMSKAFRLLNIPGAKADTQQLFLWPRNKTSISLTLRSWSRQVLGRWPTSTACWIRLDGRTHRQRTDPNLVARRHPWLKTSSPKTKGTTSGGYSFLWGRSWEPQKH